MATVELRVEDFEDGALPRICASSGAPADSRYAFRATRSALWPLLLVLVGPIGWVLMIVVSWTLHGRVDGWLPLSDAAHEATLVARRRAFRRLVEVVLAFGAIVALAAWLHWPSVGIGALVLGSLVGGYAVVSVFRPAGSVGLRWSRNGRTVIVTDVSDAFAAAYRAQEDRRIRRRRRDAATDQRAS